MQFMSIQNLQSLMVGTEASDEQNVTAEWNKHISLPVASSPGIADECLTCIWLELLVESSPISSRLAGAFYPRLLLRAFDKYTYNDY